MLRQAQKEFRIPTRGRGFYEITSEIERWVSGSGINTAQRNEKLWLDFSSRTVR